MCSQQSLCQEKIRNIKLFVDITYQKFIVCGEWSKEKLLTLLKNKLLKRIDERYDISEEDKCKTINNIISHGIYNNAVISKLLKNGIAKETIIKAMKYGIQNLQSMDLNYFYIFNITPEVLIYKNLLLSNMDQELIEKLKSFGLDEEESLNIILSGLINQNECCLFQLTLNGIATTKILNWEGPVVYVSEKMINFLRKIGIDEETLELVAEMGIYEETKEIINDLGYTESMEENYSNSEEVLICKCNLEIEEESTGPCLLASESSEEASMENISVSDVQDKAEYQRKKLILERKNYLRQNLMAPITWAMSRALKYNPTDPIHYIACQLLRWKYDNVNPSEMNETLNFVFDATLKKDCALIAEQNVEEINTENASDIPCQHCLEKMELHRIKKCCWKFMKKWIPKYPKCKYQEFCTFCKLNIPNMAETTSLDRFKQNLPNDNTSSKMIYNYETGSLNRGDIM